MSEKREREREAHLRIYGWWNLPLDGFADDTDDAGDVDVSGAR